MWAIFLLSVIMFGIIALIFVWIANKVMNQIKKDNCKTEKELENIKEKEK